MQLFPGIIFLWVTLYSIMQEKFFQHWNRVINMSQLYIYIGITKANNSDDAFEWKENQLWLLAKCCWIVIRCGSYLFIPNSLILFVLRKEIFDLRHSLFPSSLFFSLFFICDTKAFSLQRHYFINSGLFICDTTFLSFCLNTFIPDSFLHFEITILYLKRTVLALFPFKK